MSTRAFNVLVVFTLVVTVALGIAWLVTVANADADTVLFLIIGWVFGSVGSWLATSWLDG